MISTVLAGVFVLIAIEGYVSVRNSVRLFDREMENHALLLGQALAPLVVSAWLDEGEARAQEILAEVSRDNRVIHFRLLGAALARQEIRRLDPASLEELERGVSVSAKRDGPSGPGTRHTWVPVSTEDSLLGAIELTESLTALDSYRRQSALQTLGLVVLSALLGTMAIRFLGLRMVGRPLHILTAKARRVGEGDLDGRIDLHGHHEFQELATALNTMCEDLTRSRAEAIAEHSAKLQAIEQSRHNDRLHTIGEITAGVAHELGTPLNVIAGRADMIATGDHSGEAVSEFARIIKGQAERMDRIVRDLLKFGRRRSVGRVPTDLGDLVTGALRVMEPMVRKQRVEVDLTIRDTPRIDIDPPQIQQVISNLVLNALQATKPGGRIEVRVDTEPASATDPVATRDTVRVSITDHGVGMDEDQQNRLFDPFFTTKPAGEGTGLGLSISLGIVRDHTGRIDVRSEVGEGSQFDVYLPVRADG